MRLVYKGSMTDEQKKWADYGCLSVTLVILSVIFFVFFPTLGIIGIIVGAISVCI